MPVNIRIADDVVILSNFARLMNDPRHFDASQDVEGLLDEGHRSFVLELRGVPEMRSSGIGLLMTITRAIRKRGGEVVIAGPTKGMQVILRELSLEDYWEIFDEVDEAAAWFKKEPA